MNVAGLTTLEQVAIRNAMHYWLSHWDSECPTLFGLEQLELGNVAQNWPRSAEQNGEAVALAVCGSLRELLYGASAVSRARVTEIVGLSFEQTETLLHRLSERIDHALRSKA